jgi:arsenate reductase
VTVERERVLFVCTHNSARSQMAEAFLRHWGNDRYEAHSAGTEPSGLRPEVVEVMAELGIDVSAQQSKGIERYLDERFDWVVTVCDRARESCPVFPGAERTSHWGFDDPAEAEGDSEARVKVFRRVRDEIGQRIRLFLLVDERMEPDQRSPVRLASEPD